MTPYPDRFSNQGHVLVWCIIVVVALAIAVAISIPAYRKYAIRVTRMDARTELLELAGQLQRCFAITRSYALPGTALRSCAALPPVTPGGAYLITANIAAGAFLLTATPQGAQAADAACGAFTIDQLGKQGIKGKGDGGGLLGRSPAMTRGRPVWLTTILRRAVGTPG